MYIIILLTCIGIVVILPLHCRRNYTNQNESDYFLVNLRFEYCDVLSKFVLSMFLFVTCPKVYLTYYINSIWVRIYIIYTKPLLVKKNIMLPTRPILVIELMTSVNPVIFWSEEIGTHLIYSMSSIYCTSLRVTLRRTLLYY